MAQQIYLPIGGLHPIPYEFETDTMQVPRGQFSVLWALENGELTAAETMVYLSLNHGSTWNSGMTWSMSGPYLSQILGKGMSRSYVLKILSSLTDKGWIETAEKNNSSGYRYRVRHHLCDPEDIPTNKDGKPLKFAVPRGPGGPLERCFNNEISWKAALVWIVLKRRSNWKAHEDTAGQTKSETLLDLSKRCRMKNAGLQNVINELEQAGMLHRLTPKSQKAVFQLYPKPFPKPVQSASPKKATRRKPVQSAPAPTEATSPTPKPREATPPVWDGEGYFNEEYYYSKNFRYRCDRKTGDIEQKTEGQWKGISDHHRSQVMNPNIIEYFERKVYVS